jgi:hypothetical protein
MLFILALVGCPAPDGPGGVQGVTYKVAYYYDDNHDGIATGEPDEVDTVPENNRAVMLSLPPLKEYQLEGWYRVNADGSMGEKWDINTPVTEDVSLIANWAPRDYHVSYYVSTLMLWQDTIPYGYKTDDPYLSSPEQCERVDEWKAEIDAGKVFLGWATEDGGFWDFGNDPVTGDVVLHAVFGEPAQEL